MIKDRRFCPVFTGFSIRLHLWSCFVLALFLVYYIYICIGSCFPTQRFGSVGSSLSGWPVGAWVLFWFLYLWAFSL